jgi:hypothetical protein
MEKQIQCPECKSYKIESFRLGAIIFGLSCLFGGFVVFYFFSNSYTIPIIFAALGVLSIFNGIRNGTEFKCKACNYKFKINS